MRRLIAVLLLIGLLTGCAAEEAAVTEPVQEEETTVPVETIPPRQETFGLSYEPDGGLNPLTCTRLTNRTLFSLVYQGLFRNLADGTVQPVLCESYEVSDDELTHTFTLKAATFSGGTAVTAADAAACLDYARSDGYYAGRLNHVASIQTEGKGTLILTMDTPCQDISMLLDIPVVPANQITAERPFGSGPYRWVMQPGGLELDLRTDYWEALPETLVYETILLNKAASASDIRDQFEFGQTDVVCSDPASGSIAEYRCDFELWAQGTDMLVYLGCNSASAVFSRASVRAALTAAVDREALVNGPYSGFGEVAQLPCAPSSRYYDGGLAAKYGSDPDALRAAVEEAGVQGREVVLLVCSGDMARQTAAELVAQTLENAGLQVTVKAEALSDYRKSLQNGTYDLYLGQVRLSPNYDLTPFFSPDGALNYGGMADGVLYGLCLAALENSGNYYNLYEAVMDSGMLCPLLVRTYAVFASRGMFPELQPGLDSTFAGILKSPEET